MNSSSWLRRQLHDSGSGDLSSGPWAFSGSPPPAPACSGTRTGASAVDRFLDRQRNRQGTGAVDSIHQRGFLAPHHPAKVLQLQVERVRRLHLAASLAQRVLPAGADRVPIAPQLHPGKGQRPLRAQKMITVLAGMKIVGVLAAGDFVGPGRGGGVRGDDGAQGSAVKGKRDAQGVLDLQPARHGGRLGIHLADLTADVTQNVQLMNEIDQEGSALGTAAAPTHLEIIRRLQQGPHHRHRNQPPQRAALNQGAGFPNQWIVTPVVAHQDPAPGCIGHLHDPTGGGEGVGNGLFDQELDAFPGAHLGNGQVGPVGRGHNGPLGLLLLQQIGKVPVEGRRELFCHRAAAGIRIADPDQIAFRLLGNQPGVFTANQSSPHHRQRHRFHVRLSACPARLASVP